MGVRIEADLRAANAGLRQKLAEAEAEAVRMRADYKIVLEQRDALLACRHGDQRCYECPDISCCDNMKEVSSE